MGGVNGCGDVDEVLAKLGKRYGLVNRPFGIGCVPRGVQYTLMERPGEQEAHHDIARHGVLEAERPLTGAEVRCYELSPLVDGDAAEVVADLVVEKMGGYAAQYLQVQSEEDDDFQRYVLDFAMRAIDGIRLSIGDAGAVVDAVTRKLRAKVAAAAV